MTNDSGKRRIHCLSSAIGRGHPFYLRGVASALQAGESQGIGVTWATPFELSRGLSKMVWKSARMLYHAAGFAPLLGAFYTRMRSNTDYNRPSAVLSLAGRDIRRKYARDSSPLVVDHPVLVACLRGHPSLWYQHGELIAPAESRVTGATGVFVPTEEVARLFIEAGYRTDQVIISGLCIENELRVQAEKCFVERVARYEQDGPLTAALYSSGAEPTSHIEKLSQIARNITALGWKVFAFAKKAGRYERALETAFSSFDTHHREKIQLLSYQSDSELDMLTAQRFKDFDFFVAPSHERSNWAFGLGFPLFVLDPPIGSFAPLNRALLVQERVAMPAASLVDCLGNASEGQKEFRAMLVKMSRQGWRPDQLSGFETVARFLRDLPMP